MLGGGGGEGRGGKGQGDGGGRRGHAVNSVQRRKLLGRDGAGAVQKWPPSRSLEDHRPFSELLHGDCSVIQLPTLRAELCRTLSVARILNRVGLFVRRHARDRWMASESSHRICRQTETSHRLLTD